MSDPIFRFTMRAAKADPSGYYVTRWDKAQKMTVLGTTQAEAMDKAEKMLGTPGWQKEWRFIFDGSDEVCQADEAEKAGGDQ